MQKYTKEQIAEFMDNLTTKTRAEWSEVEKDQLKEIANYLDGQTFSDLKESHQHELNNQKMLLDPLTEEDLIPPIPEEALLKNTPAMDMSLLEDFVLTMRLQKLNKENSNS